METIDQMSEFERYRERRGRRTRARRMLNNLPLAHRLAAERAVDADDQAQLLGQAMVGLVEAADSFEQIDADIRFGAYAEPLIVAALDRPRNRAAVELAQAEIADAISSQDRVQELAYFLDVPVEALVGGLMDSAARERALDSAARERALDSAARERALDGRRKVRGAA